LTHWFRFQAFLGYLKKYDYDWAFWPINGTQAWSVWPSRNQGDDEVHGILARNWKSARLPDDGKEATVLTYLENIQQSTSRTPVRLVAGSAEQNPRSSPGPSPLACGADSDDPDGVSV
jgi:hypothetical protein